MRILHTSDWHIGHKIYERSRIDEHTNFLNWLLKTITEKKVEVLLVSGDIFDSSIPSAEATDIYYQFLHDLYTRTGAHAVIIAGNHDSAVRLAAPKEFLKMAGIHVIGGFRESPKECVVSFTKNGETASFAAVPYLNEGDILSHVSLEGEVERNQRYREAVKKIYTECMSSMPDDSIKILMGHFFMQGIEGSGTERFTTVGDTQPIRTGDLPEGADYIALGHLHRPQHITGNGCPIIYPGSPIPMSFKEAEYEKKVFIIDTDGTGTCSVGAIPVPVFRELVRVEMTLEDVLNSASFGNWKDKYIEVRVRLEKPEVGLGDRIRQAFDSRGGRVLVVESVLSDREDGESISASDIQSRSPADMFKDFFNEKYGENTTPDDLDELLKTFNELIEISNRQEREP
ncbi:MAG: exonuclease SbcCD subunit D C-terminal domain-containing protein [Candidatus Methanoperedens sp.]|nr:exonuclease SbcCD subunit D C-terminal domain-containing protein [Candidatus Methanoperedens sp.]